MPSRTVPPWTSVEAAVMPTRSPLEAPSEIEPPVAPSLSVGVVGATSVTAIVKLCELVSVPSEACTVMLWLVALS